MTRWKCRDCGNSALFVHEGTAKVQSLATWTGREHGYVQVIDEPVVTEVELSEQPTRCFVCKSDNITYARLMTGEIDE